jgi:hypothetical protein
MYVFIHGLHFSSVVSNAVNRPANPTSQTDHFHNFSSTRARPPAHTMRKSSAGECSVKEGEIFSGNWNYKTIQTRNRKTESFIWGKIYYSFN